MILYFSLLNTELFNLLLCLNTSDKKKSAFLSDLNFLVTIKLYNASSFPISVCSLNCFFIILIAGYSFFLFKTSTVTCLNKNSNKSPAFLNLLCLNLLINIPMYFDTIIHI